MTPKTEDPKFRKSTFRQQFEINAKLDEVLIKVGDGLYTYKDDWTDDKVAKAVSPDLKGTHVQTVRAEMFPGKVVRGAGAEAAHGLVGRVEVLEAQVEALRLEVEAMRKCRQADAGAAIGMTDKIASRGDDLLAHIPHNETEAA